MLRLLSFVILQQQHCSLNKSATSLCSQLTYVLMLGTKNNLSIWKLELEIRIAVSSS